MLPDESIPSCYFTFGLHPWHVTKDELSTIEEKIFHHFTHKNFIALGEIGLDRKVDVDFELQKEAFALQLNIASKLNIANIIIHCVKSLNDIFEVLKKSNYRGRLIFHDANFNEQETKLILEKNFLMSFGNNLLKENSKAQSSLKHCWPRSFFLETDDTNKEIALIYAKAAEILKIDSSKIELQVLKNFQDTFPFTEKLKKFK